MDDSGSDPSELNYSENGWLHMVKNFLKLVHKKAVHNLELSIYPRLLGLTDSFDTRIMFLLSVGVARCWVRWWCPMPVGPKVLCAANLAFC